MFNWEEQYVKYSLEEAVRKSVKVYGIEGAEDKAKEILNKVPIFRDKYLKTLYRLHNFGHRAWQSDFNMIYL